MSTHFSFIKEIYGNINIKKNKTLGGNKNDRYSKRKRIYTRS